MGHRVFSVISSLCSDYSLQTFTLWINSHTFYVCAQSCLTLCDSMDCSPPGSSVHGIFQARILEWVATPFSQGSSWPRDWTHVSCVSCIAGRFFTHWATNPTHCVPFPKSQLTLLLPRFPFHQYSYFVQVPDHLAKMLANLHNFFGYNGSNQSKKTNVLCDRLPTRKTFSPYSLVELVCCSSQSPDEVNVTWRTIQKSGVGFFIYFLTSHKE